MSQPQASKRVLFLDDDETRHEAFRAASIGHDVDVWHVHTAARAIARLAHLLSTWPASTTTSARSRW